MAFRISPAHGISPPQRPSSSGQQCFPAALSTSSHCHPFAPAAPPRARRCHCVTSVFSSNAPCSFGPLHFAHTAPTPRAQPTLQPPRTPYSPREHFGLHVPTATAAWRLRGSGHCRPLHARSVPAASPPLAPILTLQVQRAPFCK